MIRRTSHHCILLSLGACLYHHCGGYLIPTVLYPLATSALHNSSTSGQRSGKPCCRLFGLRARFGYE
ncbi:hypothetical protein HBI56_145050 [Parastagonospora nodorum]|nr:hypothetical protein HBH56_031980 [Parastagonospora nodorum]KAH3933579.1 hypothetical protein HBH54_067470 [Parastagonospora nodorum]KAH4001867.1 hypothetical protein HBI10_084490 [Parastagonospora nodorum]KAH4031643.1 hypothetical protein HBI13_013660 [Parastagonospora nodorum]KAH4039990.1 hypothetical protein HBI09_039480 [Parastagonospora nodorum]